MKPRRKDRRSPVVKQLLSFFKRPAIEAPDQQDEKQRYKRNFDRFPIEFKVGVSPLKDKRGEAFYDEAELHDISGNGAMFITRIPERYYPGQDLELTIFLAGTDDVRASIRTEAHVVRVHRFEGEKENIGSSKGGIAVRVNKPFEFERMAGPLEEDL